MLRFNLLISLLLFFTACNNKKDILETPVKDLEQKIRCSEDQEDQLDLSFNNKLYKIILKFQDSSIVRKDTICSKMLKDWLVSINSKQSSNSVKFVFKKAFQTASSDYLGERFRLEDGELYQFCTNQGYCKNGNLNEKLKQCEAYNIENELPKLLKHTVRPISDLKVQLFPIVSLKSLTTLASAEDFLLSSTMALGVGAEKELALKYRDYTSPKNLLAVDGALLFNYLQGAEFANDFFNLKGLLALPIIRGNSLNSVYHWKFLINKIKNILHFTASNLASSKRTDYLDLIFTINDNDVINELEERFLVFLKKQCQEKDIYDCTIHFVEDDQEVQNKLKSIREASCNFINNYLVTPTKKEFFITSEDGDLREFIINEIKNATKEITVVTHKFSDTDIMNKLKNLKKKDLKINLITGENPKINAKDIIKNLLNTQKLTTERKLPFSHMKLVIIDNQKMIFGTGNLTHNALEKAHELFLMTENKEAINEVQGVINSYQKASHVNLKFNTPNLEEKFVYLLDPEFRQINYRAKTISNNLETLAKNTTPISSIETQDKFRLINPNVNDQLKACGLNGVKVILEKDLIECLK